MIILSFEYAEGVEIDTATVVYKDDSGKKYEHTAIGSKTKIMREMESLGIYCKVLGNWHNTLRFKINPDNEDEGWWTIDE